MIVGQYKYSNSCYVYLRYGPYGYSTVTVRPYVYGGTVWVYSYGLTLILYWFRQTKAKIKKS